MITELHNLHKDLLKSHPKLGELEKEKKARILLFKISLAFGVLLILLGIYFQRISFLIIGAFGIAYNFWRGNQLDQERIKLSKEIKRKYLPLILKNCFNLQNTRHTETPSDLNFIWDAGLFKSEDYLKEQLLGEDLIEGYFQNHKFKAVNIGFQKTEDKSSINPDWAPSLFISLSHDQGIDDDLLLISTELLQTSDTSSQARYNELKKIIDLRGHKIKLEHKDLEGISTGFSINKENKDISFKHKLIPKILNLQDHLSYQSKFISIKNNRISILVFGARLFKTNNKSLTKKMDTSPLLAYYYDIQNILKLVKDFHEKDIS